MLKAAIFDVDGTLVDSNDLHAEAWREAFRHFGYDVPYLDIRHQIGKGGDQLLPVFLNQEARERDGPAIDGYKTEPFLRDCLPRVKPFQVSSDEADRSKPYPNIIAARCTSWARSTRAR